MRSAKNKVEIKGSPNLRYVLTVLQKWDYWTVRSVAVRFIHRLKKSGEDGALREAIKKAFPGMLRDKELFPSG